MSQTLNVDLDLIRKFNVAGPRYTSYPPATHFTEEVSRDALMETVRRNNADAGRDLSLYYHLPFAKACAGSAAVRRSSPPSTSRAAPTSITCGGKPRCGSRTFTPTARCGRSTSAAARRPFSSLTRFASSAR